MDILKDGKLNCISVMSRLNVKNYIEMIDNTYKNRGGIEFQREAIKQKTAIAIRERMIDDIKNGAILPAIVIGIVVPLEVFVQMQDEKILIEEYIKTIQSDDISIIDGMQRTTAIMKAYSQKKDIGTNELRIEYWISENSNNLLYRMLVLNTGQVPWNIKRQIEVIFSGVIKEIKQNIRNIEVLSLEKAARRSKGGQYQASDLIELFLTFGSRSWKINMKDKLTDEFTRHDFLQSTGETDLVSLFCEALKRLVEIDVILDQKYKPEVEADYGRFKSGKDLFSGQPARVGFISAAAEKILGRPGIKKNEFEINSERELFLNATNTLLTILGKCNSAELESFLDFSTLNALSTG